MGTTGTKTTNAKSQTNAKTATAPKTAAPTNAPKAEAPALPASEFKRGIEIQNWRTFVKASLRGYFDVCFVANGLTICGVALHERGIGGRWVGWPTRKVPAKDGKEESWMPIIKFADRAQADKMRDAILAALDRDEAERRAGSEPSGTLANPRPYEADGDDLPEFLKT